MSKIRKAITAALTAAAGSLLSAITTSGLPTDTAGWLQILGTAAGVGLAAALLVYGIRNASAVTPPSTDSIRRTFPQ